MDKEIPLLFLNSKLSNSIYKTVKFSCYLPVPLPFLLTFRFLLDPWCRVEQKTGRLLSTQTRYRQSPSRFQRQLPLSSFFKIGPPICGGKPERPRRIVPAAYISLFLSWRNSLYLRGNTQCLLHQCTENIIHTGSVVVIYIKMVTQPKDRLGKIAAGRRLQEL